MTQKYQVLLKNTFGLLLWSRGSKKVIHSFSLYWKLKSTGEVWYWHTCTKKKKKVQFPLIMLVSTESGNSCFNEHHQQILSNLNYSIALHDLDRLCNKRLKNHWRELVRSWRKLSDVADQWESIVRRFSEVRTSSLIPRQRFNVVLTTTHHE